MSNKELKDTAIFIKERFIDDCMGIFGHKIDMKRLIELIETSPLATTEETEELYKRKNIKL